MRRITNIGDEAIQRHTILFEESEIVIILRCLSFVEIWLMDIEYNGYQINGVKPSLGCLHIESHNQPFDFVVRDNSGSGIDPFKLDDFSTRRCDLFILDPEDMESLRGQPVPL